MGVLINGEWRDEELPVEYPKDGAFKRIDSAFRDRITADGSSGFPAEARRYRHGGLAAKDSPPALIHRHRGRRWLHIVNSAIHAHAQVESSLGAVAAILTWLGWLTICPALGFTTLERAAMVNRAFFGTIDPSFWDGWVIMIASLLVAIAVFFILKRAHLVRASIRTVWSVGRILALRWRCDHAAHRQPLPGDLMETLQDRPGVARWGVAKSGRIAAATIP